MFNLNGFRYICDRCETPLAFTGFCGNPDKYKDKPSKNFCDEKCYWDYIRWGKKEPDVLNRGKI
jgi:hypothetical protein